MTKKSNRDSQYNYKHFKAKDYDFKNFIGPKAGDKYIDFKATTIDGNTISLSDYLDKPVVLDTGSITCPMYANSKSPMIDLQEQYPNIHFLLLYVREAHPGSKTDGITSMEEKMNNARSMIKLYNEKRTILVDDLEGTAHKMYGAMPNMTYLIDVDGTIRFRANWTNTEALNTVLAKIETGHIETRDFYPVVKPSLRTAFRTLMIGGFRALFEFVVSLPQLIKQHKEVDAM